MPVIWMMLAALISTSCRQESGSIVFVNSYHPGYPPSDEVYRGIREGLPAGKYDLQVFYLDSKRRISEKFLESNADSAFQLINRVQPDAVIEDRGVMLTENNFILPIPLGDLTRNPNLGPQNESY